MEVKTNRYIIKYKEGIVNVPGNTIEEAIEEFKKLRIETTSKEIQGVKITEHSAEQKVWIPLKCNDGNNP